MENQQSPTIIIATAYRSFSLAAAFLYETLTTSLTGARNTQILARNYSLCFSEVDLSFIRDLFVLNPHVIGFSCFFWNLDQNLRLADLVKALSPHTVTVFGGPQVGSVNQASKLMERHRSIDVILCGEADLTFPQLIRRILDGEETRDIAGLVKRNLEGVYSNSDPCFVQDLASLPLIFHEGSEYVVKHLNRNDVIPFQTLRGCRKQCSYCLYNTLHLRLFPLERIEQELAFICRQRVKHVRVCDSHFGGSKSRAMELFRIIRDLNIETTFSIYPDPSHIDQDYLQAARNANCRAISLGVETMDPNVSRAVHRTFNAKEFQNAFASLHELGDMPQVDMMFGLPRQTRQSFQRDLVALRLCNADNVLFSPLMVLPGTLLAEHAETHGISTTDTPQRFGFSSSLGSDEYASLIVMNESYRLLSQLRRTDWYIRSALGCDSRYEKYLNTWFCSSINQHRDDLIELGETLRASAMYIKTHATCLTTRIITLLEQSLGHELLQLEFLAEVVRMDILEISMKRRREELSHSLYSHPPAQRVFFADEIVQNQWIVDEDAWLESHDLPYSIATKVENYPYDQKSNRVFCVYFCPAGTIFFVDSHEYSFLQRFSRQGPLFDKEIAYSSAILEIAKRWIGHGVLRCAR